MPMDFPDLNSLMRAAKIHNFREVEENESEEDYRKALADHVAAIDPIESHEIRNKVGWDQWSPNQELDLLNRLMIK